MRSASKMADTTVETSAAETVERRDGWLADGLAGMTAGMTAGATVGTTADATAGPMADPTV